MAQNDVSLLKAWIRLHIKSNSLMVDSASACHSISILSKYGQVASAMIVGYIAP